MPKFHNLPDILQEKSNSEVSDQLFKQAQVEKILGVAASTLEQWRLKGLGPQFVKIGRSVRYKKSALKAYIDSLPSFSSTTEADHAA